MLLKKQGFPEEGELVLCTVTSVQYNSVFAKLDEYFNKSGMIHISEVSPGRIRNMRDYVSEGRKIVCKVLKIHEERGHIDLSLRRVNESQKKNKMNEIKLEQLAEKIIEMAAKELKLDVNKLYMDIYNKASKDDYDTLYSLFEDHVREEIDLKKYVSDKKVYDYLDEIVKHRIKLPEVEIKGIIKIRSNEPEGIEIIKKILEKGVIDKENISIAYKGGGKFSLKIRSEDYKEAEEMLKRSVSEMTGFAEKNNSMFSFERVEA